MGMLNMSATGFTGYQLEDSAAFAFVLKSDICGLSMKHNTPQTQLKQLPIKFKRLASLFLSEFFADLSSATPTICK